VTEAFVARSSPSRLMLIVAGALAFVALGVWLAGILGEPPEPGREWIGWVAIIFFGGCALVAAPRLFDSSEQVKISGAGVYAKQWSEQTIPWHEIIDISVWEFRGQRSLILHLANPERYPSSTLLGKMTGVNRALTGGDVAISLTGTDRKFADALAGAEYFRRAA